MDSPKSEEGRSTNECQHSVSVDNFSMGKYEITQSQWRNVMGEKSSNFIDCDDCPLEFVRWGDVQSFTNTLNEKTDVKYRLPTEIEWEYAAKGGIKTSDRANLFASSNDLANVAWYIGNSASQPHTVGKKSPNELGLYDMSGNASEWCEDIYIAYPGCMAVSTSGEVRTVRLSGPLMSSGQTQNSVK